MENNIITHMKNIIRTEDNIIKFHYPKITYYNEVKDKLLKNGELQGFLSHVLVNNKYFFSYDMEEQTYSYVLKTDSYSNISRYDHEEIPFENDLIDLLEKIFL